MAEPIGEIVVVGGGIVGWSAAAALRRRLPAVRVTVIASEPDPGALAERVVSTLPSAIGFHQDIGLAEQDYILNAGSVLRSGTRFTGWNGGAAPYVHAHAPHGRMLGGAHFHLAWIRAKLEGAGGEPFDAYNMAAAAARQGLLVPPDADTAAAPAGAEFGLRIDPARYAYLLRAFALHLGAVERKAKPVDVTLRANDGFVESVRLDDGSEARGHLFIECTGTAAAIRSRLDDKFEDWSRWLPCDRIAFARSPTVAEPSPLDEATAMPAGWRWQSAGAETTSSGYVYASQHLSDEDAARALQEASGAEPGAAMAMRQGRRPEPWLRNCVAIGDAAVCVEPLEWTNLHLAHSAIDRIVSMMPDRGCAPVELWDYNRQCGAEADRVRDFVICHYAASSRPEDPFWSAAASVEPPASLALTLTQFRERGRLPFFEEETFSRDSWLAILLGQGVMPRRTDPLADAVPAAEARRAMEQLRRAIDAALPKLPGQGAYLNHLARQSAR
ncbi:MAG TPA: tryptophan halogenase family protein [Allosphingosinicella sp.]|jgi:tryptophan halogenase